MQALYVEDVLILCQNLRVWAPDMHQRLPMRGVSCVWLREDQLRPSAEPVQPASSHEGDEATDVCGDKGCEPTASPSSSDGAPAG